MALSIRYPGWRWKTAKLQNSSLQHGLEQRESCDENQGLRDSDQPLQPAIDALSGRVVIVDGQGTILLANRAWRSFARENGCGQEEGGIGTSYIEFLKRSVDREAAAAGQRILDVLEGRAGEFTSDYPCSCRNGRLWFRLRAARFANQGDQCVLVSHEDVTELRRAQESQHDLEGRILESRDEERRKIARELHDSTVQRILAVNLNLASLKTLLDRSDKNIQKLLAETVSLGRECMQELRTISYLLRPPVQDGHDFLPALCSYIDGFCKRSGIRVSLVIPSHAGRMPPKVENTLFRVAQEALSNIHRHSGSVTATVALRKTDERVVLEITDQGKGMPPVPEGSGDFWATGGGLAGIQERIRELSGSLEIRPVKTGAGARGAGSPRWKAGTLVRATIPLKEGYVEKPRG
jgi:signal transduction histidine kinase